MVIPPNFSDEKIEGLYGDISSFNISRDTHRALANSEFAFICSGTATLESALIGTPFVLVYIANAIDFFIGKRVLNIEHVGLANILLQHYNSSTLHRELLQDDVTVENLLREYRSSDRELFIERARELRGYLKFGSSRRVADLIMEPHLILGLGNLNLYGLMLCEKSGNYSRFNSSEWNYLGDLGILRKLLTSLLRDQLVPLLPS